MLQQLNERLQGIFAWVIIILIALTFTLVGVDYYFQSHNSSETAIKVNNEVITKAEFDAAYKRARQQRDPAEMTAANERLLKKTVLDNLVTHQLILQAALNEGFNVTTAQTAAAITSISNFQQDGAFSQERYQQLLSNALFTPETFQKEVKQGMILKQQSFAFIGTSFALPNEIERFVKLYMQTRDYNYLTIPVKLFLNKAAITDNQVKDYYQQHKKTFIADEKITIQYLALSMSALKSQMKLEESEITDYYNANQTSFQTPARWQVAHILFALPANASLELQKQIQKNAENAHRTLMTNPQQFNDWTKTLSADKKSAAVNGVLPWIYAGQGALDKILFKLTKPGEISKPFKTAAGYEIFRLIDYKPSSLKPLSEVRQQIIEQLKTEKSQTAYAQMLERLSDLSYQTPDSLQPASEELNLKSQESDFFSRKGGTDPVTANKQIVNTAFSHDVLELGNNSEPVQLNNDTVVVLRVNKHLPAAEESLAAVKDRIIEKLALEAAEIKAKALGNQFVNLQQNSPENAKLAEMHKLVWKETKQATRDTDKTDTIINELAFSMSAENTRHGRLLKNGDFVVVHLNKINNGDYAKLDKEQQASIAQQIEASHGLMLYDLYVNQLVQTAKIEKDGKN